MCRVQVVVVGLTKEVLEATGFARVQESKYAPLVLTEPATGNRAKKNRDHSDAKASRPPEGQLSPRKPDD